ncbi:MAG: ATP-binding cassette domain-containing protein [Tissierellia bacterium]|jgi:ABC-type cobalamin/Fe3+-siderophores transport system ATPase subunit|nr:ATP-binding cassette domain-containing protein [Tissierellia bacterium]
MSIVMVRNLVKEYPTFRLNSVTFFLEAGKITGFIGRNGAGKTTTIKSMLNLVHPDSGEIIFFNKPASEHESEIKKQIGYSTCIVNWYPRKRIRDIVEVTKCFYDTWDETAYHLIMLRNMHGYSQEEIAEKIGISRQAYAKGKAELPFRMLKNAIQLHNGIYWGCFESQISSNSIIPKSINATDSKLTNL